jgi:hypothetical protein
MQRHILETEIETRDQEIYMLCMILSSSYSVFFFLI